ncbi:DNA polymerase III subunit gamma/tau [bacterium]|nr:DNA polymerase III subunit gamma/tau [bacterium]
MNEKFIPLYRKYRPQTLEEIVGQEHVKKALTNAIKLNKIAHAYLFTGPRGTGKTSTARILAKSLNCTDGPTVTPCGKCASCIDITNSTPLDVVEIDAASNRSVNDAQNILEKIQYAPVNGKYKIYIIDEVHMLTVQAFNALLKTLEEPPENVIFILATTEVHKVLDTIKSRCQRFDFKRITTNDIVKHLKHIAKLEKINIEDDAVLTIAKNAAGGMRDSLALLDQLSVLDTEKAITTDDINSLLGRLSFDVLNKLSESIINSNPNDAIEILEEIYNKGNEPSQILLNLLNYFKNLLIVKNCKTELVLELTQTTDSQVEILKTQAEKLETHQIIFLTERTSYYINELKTTTNQHIWLEIAMIDLANLTENSKLIDLQNRLMKLETGETEHVTVSNYKTPPHPVQKPSMKPAGGIQPIINKKIEPIKTIESTKDITPEITPSAQEQKTSTEQPIQTGNIQELWKKLLENINYAPTRQLLIQMAKPLVITPENVVITIRTEGFVKKLNDDSNKQLLKEAVDNLFNQTNSQVVIRLPQPSDNEILLDKNSNTMPEAEQTEETKKIEQPVENKIEENTQKEPSPTKPTLNESALSDQVKMVKNLFDGKIVE